MSLEQCAGVDVRQLNSFRLTATLFELNCANTIVYLFLLPKGFWRRNIHNTQFIVISSMNQSSFVILRSEQQCNAFIRSSYRMSFDKRLFDMCLELI